MEVLLSAIEEQYRQKFPFVLYALPGSNKMIGMLQKDDGDHASAHFMENGFVFAPFEATDTLFLPEIECEIYTEVIPESNIESTTVPSEVINSEKEDYKNLVSKAITYIREGRASKIVTSRCREFNLTNLDLRILTLRLFGLYPKAFRYIWFHPRSGLWCGATPEVLITTKGKIFRTMALAGTTLYEADKKPQWTRKELNEQQWVTDALTDKLQHAASVIKVSNVRNHRAGTLVHLRTDFQGVMKKGGNGLEILTNSLHPTPAVCGAPYDGAKQFLDEHEKYDRAYYTGYLGPTNIKTSQSQLFVNLRCMKIEHDKAFLYVGGGITEDSNADSEFEETKHKLQTMLQVLKPMLCNLN